MKLSACVFIRNTFEGAFCLFESMAQLMPLVDEFVVKDLGSTDGTLQILQEIARENKKVKLLEGSFWEIDAGVFAGLANEVINDCTHEHVLYYQSDEIWHEDLIELTKKHLSNGVGDLSFWRYQLQYNFQEIKWFPHPVHRIGTKESFNFINDGMNSDKVFGTDVCSDWDMSNFIKWGEDYKDRAIELPTHQMILDVSLTGGFLDNIIGRRKLHAPFWHEPPDIEGKPAQEWYNVQSKNEQWARTESPFNIPEIMRYHVGKRTYRLRPQLLEYLKGRAKWWT